MFDSMEGVALTMVCGGDFATPVDVIPTHWPISQNSVVQCTQIGSETGALAPFDPAFRLHPRGRGVSAWRQVDSCLIALDRGRQPVGPTTWEIG